MAKYRKIPVVIEAIQLRWDTWADVCAFVGPFTNGMAGCTLDEKGHPDPYIRLRPEGDRIGFIIPTLEGTMLARQDDYIIRGVKGELYPCKPDIFAETYELVPDPTEEKQR